MTGATTSLGARTVEFLLQQTDTRIVIGVAAEKQGPDIRDSDGRFEYRRANLLRSRDLKNLFNGEEISGGYVDTVVHLAYRHLPETAGQGTHQLNISGTNSLLSHSLEARGIKRFVLRSSAMVYRISPLNPSILPETCDLDMEPDTHPIIQDEVNAEMLCRMKMDHPETEIVVLRPAYTVGKDTRSFISAFLQSRVCLTAVGYNPLVNILHHDDMVRALCLAAHNGRKGVYNIPGSETVPMNHMVRLAGRSPHAIPWRFLPAAYRGLRNLGLSTFQVEVSPERMRYPCILDGTRAARALGYEPQQRVDFSSLA